MPAECEGMYDCGPYMTPHQIIVYSMGPRTPDTEGRTQQQVTASATYPGLAAMLSAAEAQVAARFAENVSAAVQLPLAAHVYAFDRVGIGGIHADHMDGVWEVGAVRYTPAWLRVLLRRTGVDRGGGGV